jgi:pimeloyl-ACP methyl ester carboxylesterase
MLGRRSKQLAVIVVILVLSGAIFEQIGRYRDRSRFKQIGKSISIGGRKLNISCLGQGSPTVIFDTFGHQSGYSWVAVQSAVAKYTRACWYDRAGYGWSELGSSPRTFQSVASDLHALLREAGIPTPVVLVGAGDAASHIRVYSGRYPTEVGGIVMLDANDVDDSSQQIPDSEKGGFRRLFGTWASGVRRAACWARPFLGRVGILRVANLFGKPRRTNSFGLTPEQQAELDHLSDNPTTQQATEACAREESMRQVRAAGSLRSIPLIIVVSNAGRYGSSSQDLSKTVEEENRVDKVPKALASLSTKGRVLPIEGDLKPEAIVRSILDVLRKDQGAE